MSTRSEDIDSCIKRAEVIKEAIIQSVKNNEHVIQTASWINRKLQSNLAGLNFLQEVYGAASKPQLDAMRQEDFQRLMSPFNVALTRGSAYIDMSRETYQFKGQYVGIAGICSSTSATIAASTGDSAANLVVLAPAAGIPESTMDSALTKMLEATKVDDDIEYVRSQLPKIRPDISEDFDHCLTNYYAKTDTNSRYQELIGMRTMFFFRFIYGFAEISGVRHPSSTRAQQVRHFLYGSNTTSVSSADDVLALTKELWDELSEQDPSGNSVKAGTVTPIYVELVFRKAITVISALLRQREIVFR